MRPGLERVKLPAGEDRDMMARCERFTGAGLAGRTRPESLDQRSHAQGPRELVRQEGDRTLQLEVLEGCTHGEDVEVEDPSETVVGDEKHWLAE